VRRDGDPARTFFDGVCQVPAGHLVVADAGGWRAERWWRPAMGGADAGTPASEQAARLYLLLDRAVGDRSADAGATVGVAMSGGLDSCSVAAIACRRHRQIGTARPMALSLIFGDFPECDESRYLSAMEAELGIEVSRIAADRLPLLPRTGLDPNSPFAPWSAAYDEMLARLRTAGGRVVLTGQGADDLLTGSPLVLAGRLQRGDLSVVAELVMAARRHRVPVLPALYRRLVAPFLSERSRHGLRRLAGRPAEAAVPEWLHPELARRLGETDEPVRPPERDRLEAARRRTYELLVERRPFAQSLAWHEQRAARVGVEVRHPFLDRRLVEWVLTLPPTLLYRPGRPKPLLHEAVAGVLPEAVRGRRTKTRLGSFVGHNLFRSQAGWCDELLAAPLAERLGLVDGAALRSAYRAQRGAGFVVSYSMYCAIMLEAWLRWQAGRPAAAGEMAAAA
jgi:asparagine synthase (glutamine-hydrolysing)